MSLGKLMVLRMNVGSRIAGWIHKHLVNVSIAGGCRLFIVFDCCCPLVDNFLIGMAVILGLPCWRLGGWQRS